MYCSLLDWSLKNKLFPNIIFDYQINNAIVPIETMKIKYQFNYSEHHQIIINNKIISYIDLL